MDNSPITSTILLSVSAVAGPLIAAIIGILGMNKVHKSQILNDTAARKRQEAHELNIHKLQVKQEIWSRKRDVILRLFWIGFRHANDLQCEDVEIGRALNEAYIIFNDDKNVMLALQQFRTNRNIYHDIPIQEHLATLVQTMIKPLGIQLKSDTAMFEMSIKTKEVLDD